MAEADATEIDTSGISSPRAIITLIVFVLTNIIVLFPFHVPLYIPRSVYHAVVNSLASLRITEPRNVFDSPRNRAGSSWVCFRFPINFITAPLIADLFLLAILAIGREEVYGGTVGVNNINPIDIMVFFLTLAYIAISIDASGLVRYLAFKVLQKGGKVGHRLFFYLYAFFFAIGSFIGNDPIILSGTAFLAYMTRVSSNIVHPRAWIHTQFAVANIASAILVSSNPTNLVLAGAFNVRFITYTANMIVPTIATGIVLFPFLLYIVFADESLIPLSITMHELSAAARARKPVNPNIPNARGHAGEAEKEQAGGEESQLLSLEEIMNPFLDKKSAAVGAIIMAATLVGVLVINAASQKSGEHPVFYVTLPAAVLMLAWDLFYGWIHRQETREYAREGRAEIARVQQERQEQEKRAQQQEQRERLQNEQSDQGKKSEQSEGGGGTPSRRNSAEFEETADIMSGAVQPAVLVVEERGDISASDEKTHGAESTPQMPESPKTPESPEPPEPLAEPQQPESKRTTVVALCRRGYRWSQETFPTFTAVLSHLPFALVPFALSMFVLVQSLVNKGWVAVFAYGWDHWVNKTGTVGSIGGMGFLSVILCNFAGTNIGTSILLSRVIQAWVEIHKSTGAPLSDRTFWAAVYGMALGLNFGAFSIAFSASLAGLLWRDILARKHIRVHRLEFARVNLPIITISMVVGCTVLIGEIYIMRTDNPLDLSDL